MVEADAVGLFRGIGQKREEASALQSRGETPLVPGAGAGLATRLDLASV